MGTRDRNYVPLYHSLDLKLVYVNERSTDEIIHYTSYAKKFWGEV